MKKKYLIILILIGLTYLVNVSYYFKTYNQQISLQKNFLSKQTQLLATEIEKTGRQFENDLNEILFSQDITLFFLDPKIRASLENQLEIFYSRYGSLVKNIFFYNGDKEVFSLFRDNKNKFITDIYTSHTQKSLMDKGITNFQNNEYLYFLPVFKQGEITGNLVVTIDYLGYIKSVFEKSHLKDIQWQWLINPEGDLLYTNLQNKDMLQVTNMNRIKEDISSGVSGVISHTIKIDEKETDIISSYYPVRLLNRDLGVLFSLKTDALLKALITNSIIILVLTTLLIVLIIVVFEWYFKDNKRQWNKVKKSRDELLYILETLPLSIIILDEKQKIYMLNQFARDLFKEEGLKEGRKLGEWFYKISNTGETIDGSRSGENGLLYYQKGHKEHVLLKEEIPLTNQGKKLFVEVLLDITPFEKARKQEAVALKTKSEFLANMSHEIRTPLNGIIGLADNLGEENLTDEQRKFLSGIKKSAELLLSMVDDILMFSKIEAGDVFLEEIPFKLKDELDLSVKLLRAKAKEKGLKFNLSINEGVTNNLIGDPFKIRQIIGHLGDNAIKFTERGKVNIHVDSVENSMGKVVLQFQIEDTGIGISKNKLNTVFESFRQTDGSLTRKFGGAGLGTTLAKQIVKMLRGEIRVESPSGLSADPVCPGTIFTFTVELFSDERPKKIIPTEKITSLPDIKSLIIKDNDPSDQNVLDILKNFGVSCELNFYQTKTANLIESNYQSNRDRYHMLILRDSPSFNAFSLAETLHKKGLSEHYLILIISSNDKKGNNIKSRKLAVDYYLIEPCDGSEIFNILVENFPNIQLTGQKVPKIEKLRKELNILIAEDNLINQKVIQILFKNLGYEVDMVINGLKVLEQLVKKDYDIVFMDVMMPEMDGWEATSALRAKGYTLPVVAITADVSDKTRKKAKEMGLNGFITKPVKIDDIKRILIRFFAKVN